jgi:hypothetical protein
VYERLRQFFGRRGKTQSIDILTILDELGVEDALRAMGHTAENSVGGRIELVLAILTNYSIAIVLRLITGILVSIGRRSTSTYREHGDLSCDQLYPLRSRQ